jgi:tetratricopeptide (TPR) repeat protein
MVLLLAERLKCPIYGVALPGHFFCRFDDGAVRVNIEPNRRGYGHPDGYYRAKYLFRGAQWYDLEKLTKRQIVGILYYTIGTIFLKGDDPGFAAACLGESCRRFPALVEAQGNHALALALCHDSDRAIKLFEALFEKHPDFINLAANYGAVVLAAGNCRKALQIYKKGLSYFPSDPKLLIGLSQAYAACQKTDSALALPNPAELDKTLYAGIIYVKSAYNSTTESK